MWTQSEVVDRMTSHNPTGPVDPACVSFLSILKRTDTIFLQEEI